MKLPEFRTSQDQTAASRSTSMSGAFMDAQIRPMTTPHKAARHDTSIKKYDVEAEKKLAIAKYDTGIAVAGAIGDFARVVEKIDLTSQEMAMEKAAAEYKQGMADFSANETLTGGEIDPETGQQRHYGSEERYAEASERLKADILERNRFSHNRLVHQFSMEVTGTDSVNTRNLSSSGHAHQIDKAKGDGLIAVNEAKDPVYRDTLIKSMQDGGLLTGPQAAQLYKGTQDMIDNQVFAAQVESVRDSGIERLNRDREYTYSKEYTDRFGIAKAEALRSKMKERAISLSMDKMDSVYSINKSSADLDAVYRDMLSMEPEQLGVGSDKEKKELLGQVSTQMNQYKSMMKVEGGESKKAIKFSQDVSAAQARLNYDEPGVAVPQSYEGAEGKARKKAEDFSFQLAIPTVSGGGEFAYDQLTDFTNKTNRPPQSYIAEINGNIDSVNPDAQINAAMSLDAYLKDYPSMTDHFKDKSLSLKNVITGALADGSDVGAAVTTFLEKDSNPQISQNKELYKAAELSGGKEQWDYFEDKLSSDPRYEASGWGIKADIPQTMKNAYNRNFEREFLRTGDADLSYANAYDKTMSVWGLEGDRGFVNHSIYNTLGTAQDMRPVIDDTMAKMITEYSGAVVRPDDDVVAIYRGSVKGQKTWAIQLNGQNVTGPQGTLSIDATDFTVDVLTQIEQDKILSDEEKVRDEFMQAKAPSMDLIDDETAKSLTDGISVFTGYAQAGAGYDFLKDAWGIVFDSVPSIKRQILKETGGTHIDGYMPNSVPVNTRKIMHQRSVEDYRQTMLLPKNKARPDMYDEIWMKDQEAKFRKTLIRRNLPMPDY